MIELMNKKTEPVTVIGLPPMLTIQQAAEAIGVDPKTIRRRISEKTLIAYRLGPRAIRVDRDSLLQMVRPLGAA
jgi:excisionase family DNA binding protein